jgi:DNA (cytosine-5)-methyltransferase 1
MTERIVFHPHRTDGFRLQGETINTLTAFMGTGGLNVSMVATIPIHDSATRFGGARTLADGTIVQDGKGNGLGIGKDGDPMNTLTSGDRHAIYSDKLELPNVRRITPTECERLQGFPDNWTDGQADSHRYKQMGNAVTVNVAKWLGSRLG